MSMETSIINALSRPGARPFPPEMLARRIGVKKKKHKILFRETVARLLAAKTIQRLPNGELAGKQWRESGGGGAGQTGKPSRKKPADKRSEPKDLEKRSIPSRSDLYEGTIKKTSAGAGFLIVHRRPGSQDSNDPLTKDLFIAPHDLADAHTGDRVLVRKKAGWRGRPAGVVVEILERSTRTFVGRYFTQEGQGFVQVEGQTLNDPIYVGDPGAKGARSGDLVVFEMVRFPSQAVPGEGVLTHVLGERGRPGVDTLMVIHEFGLPDEFPEEVLEAARDQALRFDDENLEGRLDLTGTTIVTIDPVDARDFDDAISLSRTDDGHWHLGVHIADVPHFVPPDSPLDKEAYRRGTSVYLPDRVIPMLPEVISNGLASLQQGKVRFTKSALLEFAPDGMPIHAEFANSAIKVTQRFSYEQVMPIVRDPEKFKTRVAPEVCDLLLKMHELAMLLRRRRFAAGALELTMPEVKIDFDSHGKVSGAHVAPHDESHEVIEEFMLAANMAVATAFDDRGWPFLRRVHPDPDEAKLNAFAQFAISLGYPLKKFPGRVDFQKLLNKVRSTPHMHSINYALLRSLKQATYSPEAIGHFALAAENYCHFTSPIRRYPDLMIHRLLERLFKKGLKSAKKSVETLIVAGEHCSRTERRAEQAERELVKVKLLAYMHSRVGEEIDAVITGVQDWGFFCQGVVIPAEGLVHVSTLDHDHWSYDGESHLLEGRRSGRQFRLGAPVRVVVSAVDVARRQLNFCLAGSRAAKIVTPRRAKPAPKEPVKKDSQKKRRRRLS